MKSATRKSKLTPPKYEFRGYDTMTVPEDGRVRLPSFAINCLKLNDISDLWLYCDPLHKHQLILCPKESRRWYENELTQIIENIFGKTIEAKLALRKLIFSSCNTSMDDKYRIHLKKGSLKMLNGPCNELTIIGAKYWFEIFSIEYDFLSAITQKASSMIHNKCSS